ncbi:MAG: redoxin domain-containing protein [Candidatus Methanoperedens sp.]|nr:redoxin domain-containing protein [Candidatus Methanoperedens sp.]MCZ7396423.1 redoxin domain-containing protein [Candidatus Methanoperedens sp.]
MKAKTITLILVLIAIASAILYLESLKPVRISPQEAQIKPNVSVAAGINSSNITQEEVRPLNKEKLAKYPLAKEIVNPSGYINTDKITVSELVGKKVILIDFWTYSCINCQRTIPYLNSWYEKYKDKGLVIIGVHTPEFLFEQKYENVQAAVQKFGVKYPVVLDNSYSTWTAYNNLYWPHKYLIDIDGFIVYDHIGEGAYDETEQKIQELLNERMAVLKINESVTTEISKPAGAMNVDFTKVGSPEVYFGAGRNVYLGNGKLNTVGIQNLSEPMEVKTNILYLVGGWNFQDQFAENENSLAKIIFRYSAKSVYFVASAKDGATIQVFRDGKPLGDEAGGDVVMKNGLSIVNVSEPHLYKLIEDPAGYGEHTLEIIVENPGLQAFTFTFG